jgi:1,4-dihydroxy-2-naphthoyl-CoA synthase
MTDALLNVFLFVFIAVLAGFVGYGYAKDVQENRLKECAVQFDIRASEKCVIIVVPEASLEGLEHIKLDKDK